MDLENPLLNRERAFSTDGESKKPTSATRIGLVPAKRRTLTTKMNRWLIAVLIAIAIAVLGYEGLRVSNTYFNSLTMKDTARSALMREALKVHHMGMPDPSLIWPDSEKLIKDTLIKKGFELEVPLTGKDIAIWRDSRNFYCRIAWNQDIKIFALSVTSILFDFTVEVPIQ